MPRFARTHSAVARRIVLPDGIIVATGLTTEQLIYTGRARGWLMVPSLEPS